MSNSLITMDNCTNISQVIILHQFKNSRSYALTNKNERGFNHTYIALNFILITCIIYYIIYTWAILQYNCHLFSKIGKRNEANKLLTFPVLHFKENLITS